MSQNLAENGKTTFLVSYYPLQNLELRAISRDDGTQGVGIRHQLTFGGDSVQREAAARMELDVVEVLLEGSFAPFTAAQVREELKVKPAERFDYYAWQQDLDNLTARYIKAGHYEVRVRGRRDDVGEGRVNVVYSVTPGPATRVQVDGIELPRTTSPPFSSRGHAASSTASSSKTPRVGCNSTWCPAGSSMAS